MYMFLYKFTLKSQSSLLRLTFCPIRRVNILELCLTFCLKLGFLSLEKLREFSTFAQKKLCIATLTLHCPTSGMTFVAEGCAPETHPF